MYLGVRYPEENLKFGVFDGFKFFGITEEFVYFFKRLMKIESFNLSIRFDLNLTSIDQNI